MPICRVLVALAVTLAAATACAQKRNEPLGGKWFIRWEISRIPDSGGVHPYLHRKTTFGSRRVEDNTWRYRYLGDDCALYVAGNSDRGELMAACGDEPPVVIAPSMDDRIQGEARAGGISGDPLNVNGTPIAVAEIKRRASSGQ